jgi:hypothetical protein
VALGVGADAERETEPVLNLCADLVLDPRRIIFETASNRKTLPSSGEGMAMRGGGLVVRFRRAVGRWAGAG